MRKSKKAKAREKAKAKPVAAKKESKPKKPKKNPKRVAKGAQGDLPLEVQHAEGCTYQRGVCNCGASAAS